LNRRRRVVGEALQTAVRAIELSRTSKAWPRALRSVRAWSFLRRRTDLQLLNRGAQRGFRITGLSSHILFLTPQRFRRKTERMDGSFRRLVDAAMSVRCERGGFKLAVSVSPTLCVASRVERSRSKTCCRFCKATAARAWTSCRLVARLDAGVELLELFRDFMRGGAKLRGVGFDTVPR
jgi:hypothetical protein